MLVLVALFASYVSTAQVKFSKEFKITVGEPYKVVDAKSKRYFGDGEGHIVTVKQMESWSLFNDSMSVMAKKSAEKNTKINRIKASCKVYSM